MALTKGPPSLSDLSEARSGESDNTDLIMPAVYRAPEVLLGMPWSYPVDIWGFAMTVGTAMKWPEDFADRRQSQLWDLYQPKRLFSPHSGDGRYSEDHHIAQMIALLGPPPLDFIKSAPRAHLFWNEKGMLSAINLSELS